MGTLTPTPRVSVPQMTFSRPASGEALHQAPVFGQHARVVHADAVPDVARQVTAELRREAEVADDLGDLVLLRAGRHVDTHQGLRPLHRLRLGEVHDVDRSLMGLQKFGQRLGQGRRAVFVRERHWAGGGAHHGGRLSRAARQVLLEAADITQRRRHENELHLGQLQQRDLPGPATIRLGVEVELVHHDLADVGVSPVAQRDGSQHLGRAADDGRVRVDRGVTGEHADVLGAEELAQVEELLRDQRLDRRGVEGDLVLGERGVVSPRGDQTLARARRGRQDHVRPRDHLDQRLLLGGVQRDTALLRPTGEGLEEGIRIGVARHLIDKGGCHAPHTAFCGLRSGNRWSARDHSALRCVADRASEPEKRGTSAPGTFRVPDGSLTADTRPAAEPRQTRHTGQGGDTHDGTGALAVGSRCLAGSGGSGGGAGSSDAVAGGGRGRADLRRLPLWLRTWTRSPRPSHGPSDRSRTRCAG